MQMTEFRRLNTETLRQIQLSFLQWTLLQAQKSALYKNLEIDLMHEDIYSLLDQVPLTTHVDLLKHYPLGAFTVPPSKLLRVHVFLDKKYNMPYVIGYTEEDWLIWLNTIKRIFWVHPPAPEDVFVSLDHTIFRGQNIEEAAGMANIAVFHNPPGNLRNLLLAFHEYRITSFFAPPHIFEKLFSLYQSQKKENSLLRLRLREAFTGGAPLSKEFRELVENTFDITIYHIYGLKEFYGLGLAVECPIQDNGLHIWSDYVFPEVIDPITLERLPENSTGELVLTTLNRTSFPLLRYRTGDMVKLVTKTCSCGLVFPKIYLIGKVDAVVKPRGFPTSEKKS